MRLCRKAAYGCTRLVRLLKCPIGLHKALGGAVGRLHKALGGAVGRLHEALGKAA